MKSLVPSLIAVTLLALAAPESAEARQRTSSDWWDWAAPYLAGGQSIRTSRGTVITIPDRRRDRDWDRRRAPRYDRRGSARRTDRGPAFCRSGEGHPVFGRRWCAERGYGVYGRYDDRYSPVWRRGQWGNVRIQYPRRFVVGAPVARAGLIEILGPAYVRRFETHARGIAPGSALSGRWYQPAGQRVRVLQLRAGGVPVAELSDLDGDGIVDLLLLNGR